MMAENLSEHRVEGADLRPVENAPPGINKKPGHDDQRDKLPGKPGGEDRQLAGRPAKYQAESDQ
jgi:hypothetical protein